ncbi:hypothetical protein NDU88_002193 [Pleurodeles waltl]|uniref:Uncharacterized protein n=1 Tax=Pleurodeles waltl TaxID=8319 RepID=A0AAV7UZ43_PLEWA|nr:hypothetical protein NDU88_002193 [Pleurodeles waltl]
MVEESRELLADIPMPSLTQTDKDLKEQELTESKVIQAIHDLNSDEDTVCSSDDRINPLKVLRNYSPSSSLSYNADELPKSMTENNELE